MHVLKHPHMPTRVNTHSENKGEKTGVLSHWTDQKMSFQSAKRVSEGMEGWLPSLKELTVEGRPITVGKASGAGGSWSRCVHSQGAESNECRGAAPLPFGMQSMIPVCGMRSPHI